MRRMATDLEAFAVQLERTKADPTRLTQAGRALVSGALRIRRAGDGLYGVPPERPITKPAEAVGAWLDDLEQDATNDWNFTRTAELQEAVVAAAEEVNTAVRATPAAARLQRALYRDVLGSLNVRPPSNFVPWMIASILGGILIGMMINNKGLKNGYR